VHFLSTEIPEIGRVNVKSCVEGDEYLLVEVRLRSLETLTLKVSN